MANLQLTCMVTPTNQTTFVTLDGTPYRGDATNLVLAKPQHVTELTARGFVVAVAANVPPGNPLIDDTGWPLAV
jgi:hypothetical protein